MAKKLVVASMLAVAFIGAIFIVMNLLKNNETVVYNKNYTWHAELDSAGVETLVRGNKIDHIKNDARKLVSALNKTVEDFETTRPQTDVVKTEFPQINLQKIEQQTANVEVANDQYLTQNMGSDGAQDYLAEVTFTLTEHPGIKAVNFIFNAGDHAMPGLYSRESFAAYKIVIDDGHKR